MKYNLPIPKVVKNISQSVRSQKTSLFGLSAGERAYLAASLNQPVLYVAADYITAQNIYENIKGYVDAVIIPPLADMLTYNQGAFNAIYLQRAAGLCKAASEDVKVIVIAAASMIERLPLVKDIKSHTLFFNKGDSYKQQEVLKSLVKMGYTREEIICEVGKFASRGDIVDIYPEGESAPVRIEFFGDEIERISYFSPLTQKREREIDKITIYPITEYFLPKDIDQVIAQIHADSPKLEGEAKQRLERITDDLIFKLQSGSVSYCYQYLSYLLLNGHISDYLKKDAVIIYDEPKQCEEIMRAQYKEHLMRYSSLLSAGEVLKGMTEQYYSPEIALEQFKLFSQMALHRLTSSNSIFEPQGVEKFTVTPIAKYSGNYGEMVSDIKSHLASGFGVVLGAGSKENANKLQNGLSTQGLYIKIADACPQDIMGSGEAIILPHEFGAGCSWHQDKLIVIGTQDIYPKRQQLKRAKRGDVFFEVNVGDYVVHYIHGIGRCLGVVRLDTFGTKDYILLEYRGGDKLYVPVEQTDMLSKYSGTTPNLSKIGGNEFAKVKAKVKASIKEMSFSLRALYAERSKLKGHKYEIDDELMEAFGATFPHKETEDQLTCIKEVLQDLKQGKIMDRLLCGDVGYGKTEVALRAAFAVISNKKQVAFMSPTTILSEQHFITVSSRMKAWGIRCEVLNRFKSAAEAKAILTKLKNGEIDIICGTHRLLSKDVVFKDLGLLILDEEQRFGVESKEKIKNIKNNVNVLTLSATPIPRTLHMSLSGIRDISMLTEPPEDRLPIQTYVTELTDALIVDAISRELSRGGQAFLVYNRVETIHAFAAKVQSLLPNAKIGIGYGTMKESELENVIREFYSGNVNVLISTTIIENGIDLPMANTMIVCDADRLGLGQLYQLRGRVGRSNRISYAYFTYRPDKVLSETAAKRLETLLEFTDFGSGFKIALRDLEIRGAGNVLGKEQHGHMEKVGYELYTRLLKEARQEMETHQETTAQECRIETDEKAFVPEDYIAQSAMRMRLYNKIAAITNEEDYQSILSELKETYGSVPAQVGALVRIGLYKGLGVRAGASLIRIDKNSGIVQFEKINEKILDTAAKLSSICVLNISGKPKLVVNGNIHNNVMTILKNLAS